MCRLLIGRSSGVLRQPAGTAEALAIPGRRRRHRKVVIVMHPFMYESIVQERQAELLRQANRQRLVNAASELNRRRGRSRPTLSGWWRRLGPALRSGARRAAGVFLTSSVRLGQRSRPAA